ncbi:alpha-amylase family glycosyl hydrolase [Streptomyces xiamenensis]|uniref:Alpha-amylase n=1 Tax=Streptomyces xiamenensis TaxID=408015 RepID=A0A0F7CNA1_9ACTN|nr:MULTISPECIES: alpha-amylase family glycosyl hydrolase [Streptomyces]AKG42551.1 alpha-amylase [Streptomyces xiamenensis]
MPPFSPPPSWLADAVLYQIYPQSYADSNGDGIGDFAGVTAHLEHLSWLGVNTVWLNPCFASPFRDAGYDVSDYLSPAPRYGTEEDLARLVDEAGRLGIRVMLDLVAGHTSDEHPWFTASARDPGDHRYIWAEPGADGTLPPRFVRSPGTRPGGYLPNFFESQPALNFGYARQDAAEPWRQPVDAEGPRANRAALREVMDHWLRLGLAGFRVDMAHSLVKDDPGLVETCRLWGELRTWLDTTHRQAALLAEWGDPQMSVPAGFHADFLLQFGGPSDGLPMRSLWNNGTGTVHQHWEQRDSCYFDAGARGSAETFVSAWRSATALIGDKGFISLPTANHDFSRLCCGPRTAEQLPPAFAFQLTWPTLPAIYYGDEIGMRYLPGLPDHEGSVLEATYNRAGSRTPMQWDATPGAGFSTAPADRFYLPLDPDPDRPDVATQRADENSLLHLVRRLIALRAGTPELGGRGSVEVLSTGYPLVYVRGGRYLVAVNPGLAPVTFPYGTDGGTPRPLEVSGVRIRDGAISADGFGFGIFAL